jgi:hypothetical protein
VFEIKGIEVLVLATLAGLILIVGVALWFAGREK